MPATDGLRARISSSGAVGQRIISAVRVMPEKPLRFRPASIGGAWHGREANDPSAVLLAACADGYLGVFTEIVANVLWPARSASSETGDTLLFGPKASGIFIMDGPGQGHPRLAVYCSPVLQLLGAPLGAIAGRRGLTSQLGRHERATYSFSGRTGRSSVLTAGLLLGQESHCKSNTRSYSAHPEAGTLHLRPQGGT